MRKNKLFYFCGFFCLTAIVYAFIKGISLQLFIVGLLFIVPGLMDAIFPSIAQNRLYNPICGFLWGMAGLWMAVCINPNHFSFFSGATARWVQRIVFGAMFVFFGLGGGFCLFVELKNMWQQRKKSDPDLK